MSIEEEEPGVDALEPGLLKEGSLRPREGVATEWGVKGCMADEI
jgi:hypothetical protein